jgi:hypothetical protein
MSDGDIYSPWRDDQWEDSAAQEAERPPDAQPVDAFEEALADLEPNVDGEPYHRIMSADELHDIIRRLRAARYPTVTDEALEEAFLENETSERAKCRIRALYAAAKQGGWEEGWDRAHEPAKCGHARANYKDPKYGTPEYKGEEECEFCAALAAALQQHPTAPCSVCIGKGDPGTGKPCICGGVGTEAAELQGFRERCFELEGQQHPTGCTRCGEDDRILLCRKCRREDEQQEKGKPRVLGNPASPSDAIYWCPKKDCGLRRGHDGPCKREGKP